MRKIIYITPDDVAEMHKKTRKAVVDILNNPARRARIFPNAIKEGVGKRGLWKIPQHEAEAWQPRKYPIVPKTHA